MYAADFNDKFPDCDGAVWPWDLPAAAANAFVKNGGTRAILYCAGFTKQNNDELWAFTTRNTNEIAADNDLGYRVIGYAVAFLNSGRVRETNITESFNPGRSDHEMRSHSRKENSRSVGRTRSRMLSHSTDARTLELKMTDFCILQRMPAAAGTEIIGST